MQERREGDADRVFQLEAEVLRLSDQLSIETTALNALKRCGADLAVAVSICSVASQSSALRCHSTRSGPCGAIHPGSPRHARRRC